MLDYCVYLLFRAVIGSISLLPFPLLFRVGEFVGTLAWLFLPQYRALARRNVTIAFGEKFSPALVRRHFQLLTANLLCSIKFMSVPPDDVLQRIEIGDRAEFDRWFAQKKPIILVISHLGSWELCAQIGPLLVPGVRIGTIYQRLNNRFIEDFMQRGRSRIGVELFDRRRGFNKAIELLRGDGALGILADQHAGDQGLWAPFFNRLASTTSLPGLLAKRTGAAIFAVGVTTIGCARWRIAAEPGVYEEGKSVEEITALVNASIEQQVRRSSADWFWVHNRWKTPRPNFLLAGYKRGVYVPTDGALSRRMHETESRRLEGEPALTGSAVPPTVLQPFRILIRSSNWLGDAIMSMPAVRAIKRGRPDAHVTVAAPEKLAAAWKLLPEVDEVIALPSKSVSQTARLLRERAKFDVAILFPNSLRSALEIWLARVPRRVGFRGHRRRWLLNQIVPEEFVRGIQHQADKYLTLARSCGADAKIDWPAARPVVSRRAPLRIALCPGAEYGPAKRWAAERFDEVARAVSEKIPSAYFIFGTAGDSETGKEIAGALTGISVTDRTGETSLEELIAELRDCDLLLTNDTGTMHLASLLGVKTVAIFGSTEPALTGPLGDGHIVIRHHVECSPCFLRECPIDFRCMNEVTSAEVAAAIFQIVSADAG
ncbi:MAG: lipopolysaccharide heptosyltransferase II [Verrucomicrobiota bacterium]|nr:lipopolysaccharide heptosyltransferase II [Verrucomicrobiota bacterium]